MIAACSTIVGSRPGGTASCPTLSRSTALRLLLIEPDEKLRDSHE